MSEYSDPVYIPPGGGFSLASPIHCFNTSCTQRFAQVTPRKGEREFRFSCPICGTEYTVEWDTSLEKESIVMRVESRRLE